MTQPSTNPSTNPPTIGLGKKFDPTIDPDVQEALSIKYASGALIVIPLKSGNLALFDKSYQLHEIIPDPSEGVFNFWANLFRHSAMSRTAEARFYGEPDDQTFKQDRKKAHRIEARPDKIANDVSDFEF